MRACNGGTPVQADPSLNDYNLDSYVGRFIEAAVSQSAFIQGQHLMWTLGSDFQWTNAREWFHNLDLLIDAVNANGSLTALYSTPSIYLHVSHAPPHNSTSHPPPLPSPPSPHSPAVPCVGEERGEPHLPTQD
jgi:hypothetical protein